MIWSTGDHSLVVPVTKKLRERLRSTMASNNSKDKKPQPPSPDRPRKKKRLSLDIEIDDVDTSEVLERKISP